MAEKIIKSYQGVKPDIDPSAFIADGAVVIGDTVIGARSGIWYGCVIRGDINEIRIGAGTNIQDGTVIHVEGRGRGSGTYIGDNVTIGHQALIHACTLESNSFIGMRAVVMDRAYVETGGMVGAGAVVTRGKRVCRGELWTGIPARKQRELSEQEIAEIMASAQRYQEFAAIMRDT